MRDMPRRIFLMAHGMKHKRYIQSLTGFWPVENQRSLPQTVELSEHSPLWGAWPFGLGCWPCGEFSPSEAWRNLVLRNLHPKSAITKSKDSQSIHLLKNLLPTATWLLLSNPVQDPSSWDPIPKIQSDPVTCGWYDDGIALWRYGVVFHCADCTRPDVLAANHSSLTARCCFMPSRSSVCFLPLKEPRRV